MKFEDKLRAIFEDNPWDRWGEHRGTFGNDGTRWPGDEITGPQRDFLYDAMAGVAGSVAVDWENPFTGLATLEPHQIEDVINNLYALAEKHNVNDAQLEDCIQMLQRAIAVNNAQPLDSEDDFASAGEDGLRHQPELERCPGCGSPEVEMNSDGYPMCNNYRNCKYATHEPQGNWAVPRKPGKFLADTDV